MGELRGGRGDSSHQLNGCDPGSPLGAAAAVGAQASHLIYEATEGHTQASCDVSHVCDCLFLCWPATNTLCVRLSPLKTEVMNVRLVCVCVAVSLRTEVMDVYDRPGRHRVGA